MKNEKQLYLGKRPVEITELERAADRLSSESFCTLSSEGWKRAFGRTHRKGQGERLAASRFQQVYDEKGRLKELPTRPGAVVDPLPAVNLKESQKKILRDSGATFFVEVPVQTGTTVLFDHSDGPPTLRPPADVLKLIDDKIAELERETWPSAKHQADILRWLREELTK